jgi:hypothetical protein
MVAGDVYSGISAGVADDGFLTIRPTPIGDEASIHNIYVTETAEIEVYYTDGINSILIITNTGSLYSTQFHVTNTYYITVKNISGGAIDMGFDGIESNSA